MARPPKFRSEEKLRIVLSVLAKATSKPSVRSGLRISMTTTGRV